MKTATTIICHSIRKEMETQVFSVCGVYGLEQIHCFRNYGNSITLSLHARYTRYTLCVHTRYTQRDTHAIHFTYTLYTESTLWNLVNSN